MNERSAESIRREEYYDQHIAPTLAALSRECVENGINLLAIAEWDSTGSEEWSTYGRTLGRRSDDDAAPDPYACSDLFVGLNELANRGFLCKSITTLTISRVKEAT